MTHLPLIDIGPLVATDLTTPDAVVPDEVHEVAVQLDRACRDVGFIRLTGHGTPPDLLSDLDATARRFFALPDAEKAAIAMPRAGAAWRGWFPLGGELTSGRPDRKEGVYYGLDHSDDHPRVRAGVPLHGRNLHPEHPAELGPLVERWIAHGTALGLQVLRGLALGLGLPATWFDDHLVGDPTVLFRIFHYPPGGSDDEWGVGEHTDYGLLTLLVQDDSGGLQVRHPASGDWLEVPPDPGVIIGNIGDMLDRLTGGRYRSTAHRVRNTSGRDRLSYPLFLDPSWDAEVPVLPLDDSPPADDVDRRWDGASVQLWDGTYGDYLTAKVARVFPHLPIPAVSNPLAHTGHRSPEPATPPQR